MIAPTLGTCPACGKPYEYPREAAQGHHADSYCGGWVDGFDEGLDAQARRFGPILCRAAADEREATAARYDRWSETDTMPRAREAWPLLAAHHRQEARQLRQWAAS